MDLVRGIAILGIFAMNIISFALPSASYTDPRSPGAEQFAGPFTGANKATWFIQALIFDQKMMSAFAMLFGCGLMVMHLRGQRSGEARTVIWYRRCFVLLCFGLLHAYALWCGDVLTLYAVCGMLLWPLRKLNTRRLLVVAALLLLLGMAIITGSGIRMHRQVLLADQAQALLDAGEVPSDEQTAAIDMADQLRDTYDPGASETRTDITLRRSSPSAYLDVNAGESWFLQTKALPKYSMPKTLSMMLIGMALVRFGAVQGVRTKRQYAALAVGGLGIGGSLVATGMWLQLSHDFRFDWLFLLDGNFNYLGSGFMAAGLVGACALWPDFGGGPLCWLRSSLIACGRMAFTNYIVQTIVGVAIFSGLGLGQMGTLQRYQLVPIVLAVWAAQLLLCPWWLGRFSQGPLEGIWRRLTYGKPRERVA